MSAYAMVGEYGDYGLPYGATVHEGMGDGGQISSIEHLFSRAVFVWLYALITQVIQLDTRHASVLLQPRHTQQLRRVQQPRHTQ